MFVRRCSACDTDHRTHIQKPKVDDLGTVSILQASFDPSGNLSIVIFPRFTDLGAELVFFFDGPPARVKMTEWKRRRLNAINDLQEMLDQLARGVPSTRVEPQYSRHLPSNIGTMTCVLLKQFGCRVSGEIVSNIRNITRSWPSVNDRN